MPSFLRNLWHRLVRRKNRSTERKPRRDGFFRQARSPLSLERLENRIAPATGVTASVASNVLTVQGTASADTIVLQLVNGDPTKLAVLDGNAAVSGSPFDITTFTSVTVNGIGGTDLFDISNLTGAMASKPVTINAGSAADTYKLGNNWGTVIINDTGGGLDLFPAFTGKLRVNKASDTAGNHELEELTGAGNTVTSTLDYPSTASFTSDISAPNKGNLQTALQAIADIGDGLETTGKLAQGLEIFGGQSLGQIFDVGGILRTGLYTPVNGLAANPTLTQIVNALNQSSGVTVSATLASTGDVTYDVSLNMQGTSSNVWLKLPEEFDPYLRADGLLGDVSTGIVWTLQISQTNGGTVSTTAQNNLQLSADLNKTNFDARAGFLGLHFASPSTFFLNADVAVDMTGIVGQSNAQLQAVTASSLTQTGTALSKVDLTGTFQNIAMTFAPPAPPAPHISLTGGSANSTVNLFVTGASRTFSQNFTAAGLSDFYVVSAGGVLAQLSTFADFLDLYSQKSLTVGVPLSGSGKTLGDVLDLKDQYVANFLNLVTQQALLNNTLVSSLNHGRGVRTVAGDDLRITLSNNKTFDVDLNSSTTSSVLGTLTTVADLISKITTKAYTVNGVNSTNFEVRIDPNTGGLALVDRTGGSADFKVEALNGSLAASDLDLLSQGIVQFGETTLLKDLNNGAGVVTVVDGETDIRIALKDTTKSFDVNLDHGPNATLADIMQLIRAASPNLTSQDLEISLDTVDRRLLITDHTSGSGNFSIMPLHGSTAITDLRINSTTNSIAAPKIIAQNIGFKGPNFGSVQELASNASGQITLLAYDASTHKLSFTLDVNVGQSQTDTVSLINTGPLQNLTVTNGATLSMTPASGTKLHLPFEVLLTNVGDGFDLGSGTTSTTPLGALNRGFGVRTIAGQNDIHVQLRNASKSFDVNLDHDPSSVLLSSLGLTATSGANNDITFTLKDGSSFGIDFGTLGTKTLANLVSMINAGAATAFGATQTKFLATIDPARGSLLFIDRSTGAGSFDVTAPSGLGLGSTTVGLLDNVLETFAEASYFTLGDLIDKINDAAVAAGITTAQFQVLIAPDGKGLVAVDSTSGTATFEITSLGGSLASRDLGFPTSGTELALTQNTLLADFNRGTGVRVNAAGTSDLRVSLRDGTHFDVDLDSTLTTLGAVLQRVQTAADTLYGTGQTRFLAAVDPNTGIPSFFDFTLGSSTFAVSTLNGSFARADLGLTSEAADSPTSAGLMAKVLAVASQDFSIVGTEQELTPDTLLDDLNRGAGVSVNAAGTTDFRVTLRDNSFFDVDLDSTLTTLDDVLQRIQAAADAKFGSGQTNFLATTDSTTGKPSLFDLTSGSTTFAVSILNGSSARDDLGLTASGADGHTPDGTTAKIISVSSTDFYIVGTPLHGDTTSAHYGIRGGTLSSTINLSASNINASGTWGVVGVNVVGGSITTGNVSFGLTFADSGTDSADGLASLRELREGLADTANITTGITKSGNLSLNLPLHVTAMTALPGSAPLTVTVANVFNTSADPVLAFTSSTTVGSFLSHAQTLTIDDALDALRGTAAYLRSLQEVTTVNGLPNELTKSIPGINRSVGQMLEFGDKFDALLDSLEANPPSTLQGLQAAFDALPGISGVSFDFDSTVNSEALKVNFTFTQSQVAQQRLQLVLAEIVADLASHGFTTEATALAADLIAKGLTTASMIVDAENDSPVTVTADASITFGVGVNLTTNHDGFLYGGSSSTMSFHMKALQNDLNFEALFGARTVQIVGGSYVFDSDGSGSSTVPAGYSITLPSGRHGFDVAVDDSSTSFSGKFSTTLPVKYGPELNQPAKSFINLSVLYPLVSNSVTLTTSGPNIDSTLASTPLNGNIQGLRAGFRELFRLLDLAFDAAVFSRKLPFVGDQLMQAADFIEQIRDKVGDNLDLITGVLTPAKMQQALFDAFGDGGLNWLQDSNGDGAANIRDIVINNSPNGTTFALTLTMPQQLLEIPINVDTALPGLGLQINALARVMFGFSMPLKFGIDTTHGVYLDNSSIDDMTMTMSASLPTTSDPNGFTGSLGNLPYFIKERTGTQTGMQGSFDFTLRDPNTDGKLTLNEMLGGLGSVSRPTQDAAKTAAQAIVLGGFNSTYNYMHLSLTSNLPAGTALPHYRMDVDIGNSTISSTIGTTSTTLGWTTPSITFDNTQFELVSFVRDFLGSALTRLRTAFVPMDGVVDFMLSNAFPFLSIVFGRAPYTSANTFGGNADIGNFAGASWGIRHIVDGGTLVGSLKPFTNTYGIVPFGLIPDAPYPFASIPDSTPPAPGSPAPPPLPFTPEFLAWAKLTGVAPLATLTGEAWINLGSPSETDFTIDGEAAKQELGRGVEALVPQNVHGRPFGSPGDAAGVSILGDIHALASNVLTPDGVQDAALDFLATQLLPGHNKFEGFFGGGIQFLIGFGIEPVRIPILTDVSKSFSLLFGDFHLGNPSVAAQDTQLFTYATPELFLYLYKDIPISKEQLAEKILKEGTILGVLTSFGIKVEAFIPVAFEARADFGTAFDTTGLEAYSHTHNPGDIVSGFYFNDLDGVNPNGPGQAPTAGSLWDPEEAHMIGGAGLGVQIIFDASVLRLQIGIEALALIGSSWNLHDADDSDGLHRVRAYEFDVAQMTSVYDQFVRFEIRADVFVKLSVGISIFRVTIIDIRFNLFTIPFDIPILGQTFNSLPTLATNASGQLTLNFNYDSTANKTFYVGAGDNDGDIIVSATVRYSFDLSVLGLGIVNYDISYHKLFTGITGIIGQGGAGDDQVYVSAAVKVPVVLRGGAGNDMLVGGSGDDFLYGEDGNDIILGGGGNDTIAGGNDDDTILGGDGNDTVDAGAGNDTIFGEGGDDIIFAGIGADILWGGLGADRLRGGDGDDEIHGGKGNDRIRGGKGKDRMYGDDGADTFEDDDHDDDDDDLIYGGLGNDVIYAAAGNDQVYGDENNDTIYGGTGNDRLDGGGASDRVWGDDGPPNPDPSGDDLIISRAGNDFLDGQGGNDIYLIDFQGDDASSLIMVLDTGSAAGTDLFTATGTVQNDQFLLRANAGGSNAFVAMVNSASDVERINYSGVERIVVNGSLGNDSFAVDDTSAEITLNGEEGADSFQIGQLYQSQRTQVDANVSVDDEFATIETTRGFLSNGVSRPMVVNGGTGDDRFTVFHNKAHLSLNGDDGDDTFEVRAFALAGSQEPQRARTDISGGAGADLVEYAVNAPVDVDGGDGFDTVVIIGTEFGDDFVITKDGVFGGGLTVSYVNIESLRIDGAEGDDRFYIQSTNEKIATEILGGLGNDTFNMSGDAPPVVSNDLRGHSGLITHDVESLDPLFDGTSVFGVSAHVADADEPGVVIRPTNGSTIITEGGTGDTYTVVLTHAPLMDILVKALAPLPTPDQRDRGMRSFSLSSTATGAVSTSDGTSVTLRFTPSNWFIPQTVNVVANSTTFSDPAGLQTRPELGEAATFTYDDSAYEGPRVGIINHIILADLASFTGGLGKAQVTSVTAATEAVIGVSGTVATNDTFTFTINGAAYPYTAIAGDTLGSVLDGLRAAFNAAKALAPTGPLQFITADHMTQKTVTMTGTVDAGDQFTATFGTTVLTYTVPDSGVFTLAEAAHGFAQLINAANITGVTADDRAANGTFDVRFFSTTSFAVAELTDPGNNSGVTLGTASELLVVNTEDGDFLTNDARNFTVSDTAAGASLVINVDGSAGATTAVADATGLTAALIGRKIQLTSGPGAGQERFVVGISGSILTMDRPWNVDDMPTFQSTYIIRMDDAIVGTPTSVNNTSFTFTDTAHATPFPTSGEGLRGRVLRIVGGPGAGQERLILSNTADTLTLNGAWRTPPTSGSIYRIDMYDGMAVPSVLVQMNDNDQPGLIVDEQQAFNGGSVVSDLDNVTAVIEGSDGDHVGEQDVVQVRLSANPGATNVTVQLVYDSTQISLTNLDDTLIPGGQLIFTSGNWNIPQTVRIAAFADLVREGFHTSLIKFDITTGSASGNVSTTDTLTIPADRPVFYVGVKHTITGNVTVTRNSVAIPLASDNPTGLGYEINGNKIIFKDAGEFTSLSGTIAVTYSYLQIGYFKGAPTPSVLVRIADKDAPTVLVRETGGSTDVIESTHSQQLATDDYQVVLTKSPEAGKTVTVTVTSDITKTTRTGGIRHDAKQVTLSSTDSRVTVSPDGTSMTIVFSDSNWDDPVVVTVTAKIDNVVDGGDTKVFAPGPHTVSGILGPITIDGGGGQGSLAGLPQPVRLPGETNVKAKNGDVVSVTGTVAVVLTSDLQAVLGSTNYDELLGRTFQVTGVIPATNTSHSALGQFRQIVNVTVNNNGTTSLALNAPFDYNQNGNTGESDSDIKNFAITSESPNFFVNEASQVDVMFVHDEDSPADSAMTLTSTRLTGLHMGPDVTIGGNKLVAGGITYGNLEVLDITLGSGFNNVDVLGTPTRSDGFQTWTIIRTGDDILDPNNPSTRVGDTVTIKVNAADGVSAEHTATSATSASPIAFATITDSSANFPTTHGGLQGQLLTITSGVGAGQTRRILSNTATTLVVNKGWDTLPDSTSHFTLTKEKDGNVSVDVQGGNDVVDASASTHGVIVFGGLGQDTITGGSGDDILFGDRGRVDFSNQSGVIVTRLGTAPAPITGFVTTQVTSGTLNTLTDANTSFPVPDDVIDNSGDDDVGLRGLYVSINNGTGFLQTSQLITNNTLHSLTLSPGFDINVALPGPGGTIPSQYRISTLPENQTDGVVRDASRIITVDDALGDIDTIYAGAGDDQVFGGAGADILHGEADDDTIVGDAGRLDKIADPAATVDVFTPGQQAPEVPTVHAWLRTKSFTIGAGDQIYGDAGHDILLGGFGADTLSAGEGNNIVLGDDGQIDYARSLRAPVGTAGADADPFDMDLIESLSTSANGAADTITAGSGDDLIIGGRFGDTIDAGEGENLVIGDHGRVTASSSNGPNLIGGQPVTLGLVETMAFDDGGDDTITTGSGDDIILGGFGGDTIIAGDGNNLILGDDGQVDYTRNDRAPGDQGANSDAGNIDLVESLSTTSGGGVDHITAGSGDDIVIGGRFGDILEPGDGNNIVAGDSARIRGNDVPISGQLLTLGLLETIQHDDGGVDEITTGSGNDIVLGGNAGDIITLGAGDDIALGDNGSLSYAFVNIIATTDTTTTTGGDDLIYGNDGDDVLAGGVGDDTIDGNNDRDLIFGDNVSLQGRSGGTLTDPRIRSLLAATLYDLLGDSAIAPSQQFADPNNDAAWHNWIITLDDGMTGLYGNDYIAGGAQNDSLFGQRGNDLLQGDASIAGKLLATPVLVGAYRDINGLLVVSGSVEAATDGDDYIEGGGDDDVLFGNLGQDDLIGGNSSLFGLTVAAKRHDGSDFIFGGGGFELARNDVGDTSATGHSRDADVILGDNGNIYRIVGTAGANTGSFLTFNYDNYNAGTGSTNKIIPRSIKFVDYTPGSGAASDNGAADELHGETGDDIIKGQTGADVLFGEGQDDDLAGGAGPDWITGGTGDDGILGDDGVIWTSRNGLAEPLYGIVAIAGSQLDKTLSTSSRQIQATINVTGELKKTADLQPFEFGDNDIIYGGLGNDSLHGGAGDDAISGAEALPSFFDVPVNPGNVLGYGTVRAGEFAAFKYFDPRAKIAGFLLNFDVTAAGIKVDDGQDALFGDDGNDWLVGGTQSDHLFGGTGNDLLSADDNTDTDSGRNGGNEPAPFDDADIAFGGGGHDILIANTTLDRLIDWSNNTNFFIVPFGAVTAPTVTTAQDSSLYLLLYGISGSDGADPTRTGANLGSPTRNGEPFGELGLFTPTDPGYQGQTSTGIVPNNVPTLNFKTAKSTFEEGVGTATIIVSLSLPADHSVSVDYAVTGGTASGADHTLTTGTLVFEIGELTKAISVGLVDDMLDEDGETLVVTLADPVGAPLGASTTHTLTIVDNDQPPAVSFDVVSSSGSEASPGSVAVSLSAPSGKQVTVHYAISGGSATSKTDYTLVAGTLTFAPGVTTQSINLGVLNDSMKEGNETIRISLNKPTDAVLGRLTSHTYTITDNDAAPTVGFATTSSSIGEAGKKILIMVSLSAVSGLPVTVDYSASGGTASIGADYSLASGTLTFAPGQTSKTIVVRVVHDKLDENDETIVVSLSNPSNATLGANSAHTVSIVDDHALPLVLFGTATSSGEEGSGKATLLVSLSAVSGRSVTVDYAVTGGTATGGGVDYTLANGTLTFAAGETTAVIVIDLPNDGAIEATKTVQVTLSNPTNALLGSRSVHTFSIIDNDSAPASNPTPAVAFKAAISSAQEGSGTATVLVSLSSATNHSISVDYTVAGTATSGADYVLAAGTLTFAPGEVTKSIAIGLLEDTTDEDNETVVLTLSNPVGATLGASKVHTLTITDNDAPPSVAFDFAHSSGSEASAGSVGVTLSAISDKIVTVHYAITGGSAQQPEDYSLVKGTLTFAPGETTKSIPLAVVEDALSEADETVVVTLSAPVNAVLGANVNTTYTIVDNDAGPTVAFQTTTTTIGEGVASVALTVTLSAASAQTVTVDYAATGGSAQAGLDYALANGTISFAPGQLSKTIVISIVHDKLDEADETIVVELSNSSHATLGVNSAHTVTVTDDDNPPTVAFSSAVGSGEESLGTALALVQLSAPSGNTISVNYTVTGGSAVSGVNYTLANGTLTFVPGQTSVAIPITLINDGAASGNKTIEITLSSPANAGLGGIVMQVFTIVASV